MPLLFPIGSSCIGFFLAFGLNWLALIPWRRSVGKHWTERARLLYPALASMALKTLVIPLCLGFISYILDSEINFLLVGLMGYLGVLLAGFLSRNFSFITIRTMAPHYDCLFLYFLEMEFSTAGYCSF
jgi:hypothetical protein